MSRFKEDSILCTLNSDAGRNIRFGCTVSLTPQSHATDEEGKEENRLGSAVVTIVFPGFSGYLLFRKRTSVWEECGIKL